jgi:hypothetical protein
MDAGDQQQQQQQQQQQGRGRGGGFQIQRNQWRKLKRKLRRNVELDDRMSEDEEKGVRMLTELSIFFCCR